MTAVPARRSVLSGQVDRWRPGQPVPLPHRIDGRPDLVRGYAAQLIRQAHAVGLLVERIPRDELPDGTITMDVVYHAPPSTRRRWWQGRSWKFWTPVGAGAVVAFGGCLVAAVIVLKALIGAAVAVATMALGALVLVGFVALLGSTGGGGFFSGTFKGRMD